jgi:ADP-ribosyl-[dinitrogen reductase] hydrolase
MDKRITPRLSEEANAGVWGFIVGDALGVPYEFNSREEMSAQPATGMAGWGTHYQPPGTWSDDTSMMLCVLENNHAGGESRDLANLFVRWLDEGYHTPHGKVFDIGVTTETALRRFKNNVNPSGLNDKNSAGNGSLMRCLPYAFRDCFENAVFDLLKDNMITHSFWQCSTSCLFYARMARALADGESKDAALKKAGDYVITQGWRISNHTNDDIKESPFKRLFEESFHHLPERQIRSGGYVIESLEAAVWSFMNGTDYRSSVLQAVNLGEDTDTNAALAGGLAAIHYGIEDVPGEWMDAIVRRSELEDMISGWVGL